MNQLISRYIAHIPMVLAKKANLFFIWATLAIPLPRLRIVRALVRKKLFLFSSLKVNIKYPTSSRIIGMIIHQEKKSSFP